MTVRELETRIQNSELIEWMVYFGMEPWGAQQADYRAGVTCSVIAKSMGGNDVPPDKFFPLYKERDATPKQSATDQLNIFKGLADAKGFQNRK